MADFDMLMGNRRVTQIGGSGEARESLFDEFIK